ncbi:MAG: hypothetical protein EAZ62_08405, partial [Sphingobacteriia bacterium]
MPFSLHHIAQAWDLPAPPPPLADQVVAHLVTDSRQVVFPASSLFFALPGPRRSGSDFVAAAYQRGVRFFVVDEVPTIAQQGEPLAWSTHFFVVPDVLKALQDLAALHRQQFDYPVLGITGSNGKTMVKEWLYQLLQADYRIVRSPRSYNSQIGVPLSVWQMDAQHNLALLEAGISQTGEMQKLAQVMAPTMGIFTGLGPAHDAGFNSSEQKLKEKLQLFATAKTWVVAADGLPDFAPPAGVQLFTWGKAEASSKTVASIVSTISSSTPPTQGSILPATPSHQHLHWLSSRALDGGQELVLRFQENEFSIWVPFADEVSARNALTCLLTLL